MASLTLGVTSTVAYERRPAGGGAPTDVSNPKYKMNVTGSTGDVTVTVNTSNITRVPQLKAALDEILQQARSGAFGLLP